MNKHEDISENKECIHLNSQTEFLRENSISNSSIASESNNSVNSKLNNSVNKNLITVNPKHESTQLLNIVNEEISNISSSSFSVYSGKKLSIPSSTIRRKSVNFINSIKNTTLTNASKILSLGSSISSTSYSPTGNLQVNPVEALNQSISYLNEQNKQPIDLEAHIIVSDKRQRRNIVSTRLRNVGKRITDKIIKSHKKEIFEEIQKDLTYDDDSDEYEEDEDEDNEDTFQCNIKTTSDQNGKEYESNDEDINQELLNDKITIKDNIKSLNLNSSIYDEEDINENLSSVNCDLDEAYFFDVSKNKPTQFTSNLIKNSSQNQCSQVLKVPKPISATPYDFGNQNSQSDNINIGSKIDLTTRNENTSFKSYFLNQAEQNNIEEENKRQSENIYELNESSKIVPLCSISNNEYLNIQSNLKNVQNLNQNNLNLNPVFKTILNKNKSFSNINLSVNTENNTNGSRLSVTFSENPVLKSNESKTYQRSISFNCKNDEETTPLPKNLKDIENCQNSNYDQQNSIVTAPVVNTHSISDYDLYYLNNLLSEDVNAVNKKFLSPYEATLNSSSISSNFNYSSSFVGKVPQPAAPVSIRVLHKSMTKGSKAMRVMGNNNTLLTGNGPLKSSFSSGALSLKSGKSIRGTNAKKQQQKRLFFKNGNINISRCNIDKRRRRYLTDIFTTLIDLKWRYNIIVFVLGFISSWIFFAITWYLISFVHGDLDNTDKNHTACVTGISSFAGAILFSIETQQTIGYGVRFTTEKCPEAIFVMMIQSSFGVMIQSFMVGIVFAKLSRPKKRSETLMFSKNAVISLRDGRLCLICRVGDMRKSHIVEAHVRMYLIKKRVTLEGEIMPLHMYDLNVGWDKGADRLFLVWPLTIEHYIDQNSPFYNIGAEDLKKERFEIAVILEGIVESTGMTTQARSSYLVNEILWGHRFEKLITFQKEDGTYKIDYSRFNMTVPIDTPTCSARELAEAKEQEYSFENYNDSVQSTNFSKYIINDDNNLNELRKRKIANRDENCPVEHNLDELNIQKQNKEVSEKGNETGSALNRTATESTLVNSAIPSIVIAEKNCDISWSYNIDKSNSKSDLTIV